MSTDETDRPAGAHGVWILLWFDRALQDVRYAARVLRRSPGFSATLLITLALGIGMNTAVFSVVNAVLLRPLSYSQPERLVWIATYDDRSPMEMVIAPDYLAWRDYATTLDRVAAFSIGTERIAGRSEVVAARVATVSYEFWNLAAAAPALGRLPSSSEDAIMLSDAFFERAFARDGSVVGRPISVNGREVAIAGVLPRSFHPELPPPVAAAQLGPGALDAYHATVVRPPAPTDPGIRLFNVIARLKPGVTLTRAAAELEALRVSAASLGGRPRAPHLRVIRYADKLVGRARTPLMILLAAVLLVLAIACANIANLLLVRGSARRREIAIRVAVGAGRGRVVQQFVVESLLLAAAGAAAGLLVARGGLALMLALIPYALPRLSDTTIDGGVLAFALALSAATAMVFGVAPAIAVWRTHPQQSLQHASRAAAPSASRTRGALVVTEIALASVLLVGAALTVKSLWRIAAPPPGFSPQQVLTMKFQSNPRREYVAEVIRRAQAIPGVSAAGISSNGESRTILRIDGTPAVPYNQLPLVRLSVTSSGYASAIGMRVVQGRWFAEHESERVCVINEALARVHFAGSDPIGRRILLATGPNSGEFGSVVGVVADLRYSNLEAPPEPELFVDYEHAPLFALNLAIRTRGDPRALAPAVRASLSGIDPSRPIFDVKTLEAVLTDSIAPRRFNVFLLGTFAVTALLLSVVGIYGVMAYSVAQRTHEIGVRMALGAERRAVIAMVVRQGMTLAAAGMALGALAAAASSRIMTSLLYDVTPTDPATFVSAIGVLGVAASIACWLPARRASRVDPTVALRCE